MRVKHTLVCSPYRKTAADMLAAPRKPQRALMRPQRDCPMCDAELRWGRVKRKPCESCEVHTNGWHHHVACPKCEGTWLERCPESVTADPSSAAAVTVAIALCIVAVAALATLVIYAARH